MKMKKCKYCGCIYPNRLSNCPECFHRNYDYIARIIIGVFLILFVSISTFFCIYNLFDNGTVEETLKVVPSDAAISLEEFNKIETGMTYEEVCEIIGGNGVLNSSVDLDMGDDYKTELYTWDGEGELGANANITFQGGKVIAKAQIGLR